MARHNMLEAHSLEVPTAICNIVDFIGFILQKVENLLAKPRWSALRQVSFKLTIVHLNWGDTAEFTESLQSLPDKYLNHFPKLESAIQLTRCLTRNLN